MNDRGFWYRVKIVLRKEVRDHRRDLRSVLLSLFFPLMAPVMLGLLLHYATGAVENDEDTQTGSIRSVIALAGAEYAPDLVAFLEARPGIQVKRLEADRQELETKIIEADLPFAIWVPPEAADQQIFRVEVLHDRARTRSLVLTGQAMPHLVAYSRQKGRAVIEEAGLNPDLLSPVSVEQVNLGKAPNIAQLFYRMVPPLMMFMIFMGAVYLAIDVTVGERERGSLEPLLTAPLSRAEVLMGKAIAAFGFTAAVVSVNLTAFWVVLQWAAGGNPMLASPPEAATFLQCYLIALPLIGLAVAIQMSVAALTRSAKEAQIYLGLLPLVPLVPGLYLTFQPNDPGIAHLLIPILGQLSQFLSLIEGTPIEPGHAAITSLTTLVVAAGVFAFAAHLFRQERFVFAK